MTHTAPSTSRSPEARRERRKLSAGARQAVAALRTPEEQLARLDAAFGAGVGAKKERAKLLRKIEAAFKARKVK